MDQRERFSDFDEVIRQSVRAQIAELWTAAPVVIETFDPETLTCTAMLQYMRRVQQPDSSWVWLPGAQLILCPVIFPSGAGFTFFAPPRPGDEALAIFGARSIDEWREWGGPGRHRNDLRMHSNSDAFILAGIWNQTRVPLGAVDPTALQIRDAAGLVNLRLQPGAIIMTAPTVTVNGALVVNGTITSSGDSSGGATGVTLETHVHPSGTPVTGPPQAP